MGGLPRRRTPGWHVALHMSSQMDRCKRPSRALSELDQASRKRQPDIGVGQDADHKVLQRFMGNPEIQPLQANNPEALFEYFKWVSSTVLDSVSDVRDENHEEQVVETVKAPPALEQAEVHVDAMQCR